MNATQWLRNQVLDALYDELPPPTLRTDIIHPLCQSDFVTVTARHPSGMIKSVELTAAGRVFVEMQRESRQEAVQTKYEKFVDEVLAPGTYGWCDDDEMYRLGASSRAEAIRWGRRWSMDSVSTFTTAKVTRVGEDDCDVEDVRTHRNPNYDP